MVFKELKGEPDSLVRRGSCVESIAIVEGPLDALAVSELPGFMGIGLMGIKPSGEALDHLYALLVQHKPKKVYCVADRDEVHGMCAVQSFLAIRGIGSQLVIPEYKDVCATPKEERAALFT
jgi:hypothetical protein